MSLLGIILLLIILFFIYLWNSNKKSKIEKNISEQEELDNIKREYVRPRIKSYGQDVQELYDFFFSIQDFYKYNPQAYEESIENINSFFKMYDYATRDSGKCGYYYDIAESKKENALNSIQSIIFNLPPEDIFDDKITRAHLRLDTILTKYLNYFYRLCQADLFKNGFTTNTKTIYRGPKEYNNYNDEIFSYQFY